MAGANAIFTGERMLTTPTNGWDEDISMLDRWGLKGMKSSHEHLPTSAQIAAAEGEPVDGEEPVQENPKDVEKKQDKLEDEMMDINKEANIKEKEEAQPQIWS
jgi:biotin synthase